MPGTYYRLSKKKKKKTRLLQDKSKITFYMEKKEIRRGRG